MSITTSQETVTPYEPVLQPRDATATWQAPSQPETALFRLRSAQPSRRAVLHLQAAGDPVVPADLGAWFTERACNFYLAGLRLPARPATRWWRWRSGRAAERAFGALDAVCARLRATDGIERVIVSAQGRAAATAALWSDRRGGGTARAGLHGGGYGSAPEPAAVDALILYQPVWPAGKQLRLKIRCPVLVLSGVSSPRPVRPWRPGTAAWLGSHVTWLQLPDLPGPGNRAWLAGVATGPARRAVFAELGRWLGAYMYGLPLDQLL